MCTRRILEVGARVRGTLTREGQKVKMLAVVRVVKPQVGMGLEFLDIDPDSYMQRCWPGSIIFANRTESSVTAGGCAPHDGEDLKSEAQIPAHLVAEGHVAWHGGDLQLFSCVWTLGMGGLFISVPDPPPVGTKLRLSFDVPGGNVHAEAIVRKIVRGEGMGVEFTKLRLKDRILSEQLLKLKRLLR